MNAANVRLVATLKQKKALLVTAESLTGGLIAQRITSVPGSSAVFWGGFTVYAVEAKEQLLGLNSAMIEECGVVSEEISVVMAARALNCLPVKHNILRCAIAVTGLAGPDGGSFALPVGTVCISCWIALYDVFSVFSKKCFFSGNRDAIREHTYTESVEMLLALLDKSKVKALQ